MRSGATPAPKPPNRSAPSAGNPALAVLRHSADERGGGPISIWFGFSAFLVLLLFHRVTFNLYAASVVTAVS